MSADEKTKLELAALQQLLDTCGDDAARWPKGAADRFAPLLARDATARTALLEAAALNRLLNAAPQVAPERSRRLADRIVAEAIQAMATSPQTQSHREGNVVDLAAARRAAVKPQAPRRAAVWQTATALAACLALGVLIGASDLLGPALDGVVYMAGLADDGDTLTSALGQAIHSSIDEETL